MCVTSNKFVNLFHLLDEEQLNDANILTTKNQYTNTNSDVDLIKDDIFSTTSGIRNTSSNEDAMNLTEITTRKITSKSASYSYDDHSATTRIFDPATTQDQIDDTSYSKNKKILSVYLKSSIVIYRDLYNFNPISILPLLFLKRKQRFVYQ